MYNKKELKAGPLTHKKSNPFGKDVDYIPFDGESQYMYLTDEEIAAYKAGGYVVEEDGGDIYFPPKSNPANDFAVTDPRSMAKGGAYYDDSRDAWVYEDGTVGPNGPAYYKNGGELDTYPKGGGTGKNKKGNSKNVQPFVTSDPDEYAYRKAAYDDSLRYYKAYIMQDKLMGPGNKKEKGYIKWGTAELKKGRTRRYDKHLKGWYADDHQNEDDQFKKGYNPFSARKEDQQLIKYYKSLGFTDKDIMYHSSPDVVSDKIKAIGSYNDGYAVSPVYKKPVQPVIFQEPPKPQPSIKPKPPVKKELVEEVEVKPNVIPQPIPTVVNPEPVIERKPEPPRPGTDVMPVYDTDELPMYATPDPDAEWVGNTERYVDWDGNKIPYRLPKFRKPGHSGDLVKPGKRRYIPIPSIETRYQAEIVPEKQFKNGGALNIPWYKYAGNTYTHYNMGGNTDPGNNALELHMFYDKDVFKDGGEPRPKEIGPTYYYPGRTGSEYKLNDSGQWTIKNSSTNGKFVPIKDPNGTRSAELDRHALDSGEFAEYQKNLKYQIENPKAPQMYIKDTRTVRATSGNPINPNVDLKSSNYNQDVITNIIKRAKAYGVDPATAVAVGLQESMLGKTDTNIGHMLHGDPNDPYAYIPFLKQSMDRGKNNLGYNDVYRQLQVYNGLGVITPQTEKKYHGYSMGKIYGVPIPAGGINMKQNPLYGKEIMDIRNNVLMKNPQFVKLLKQTKARRFDEGGSYYEDELTNDEIQALRAAGYQVDEL